MGGGGGGGAAAPPPPPFNAMVDPPLIIGMDYHNQQVPIHCRVCWQRLTKYRAKKSISYECKAFSAELKIAFDINTSGDDVNIHPEMFCIHCKLSMQRTICAITKGVHHKCAVILFEWEKHTDQECKVNSTHLLFKSKHMTSWCSGT